MELRDVLDRIDVETVEDALKRRILNIELSTLVVVAAILAYTIVASFLTIMKNYRFGTYAWDLGIFNQAFWTTAHNGRLFYYTPELLINPSGSFFGIHVSPVLFLILPFYAIVSAPETLLVTQSFVLALSVVPLYKLSRNVLESRAAGLIFAMAYLLYPPLHGVNWFDFHVQSFLPLFLSSTIYFLEKQNWKGYFLCVVLSLAVEEHASIVIVFIGFLGLLQNRERFISLVKSGNPGRRLLKDSAFRISVVTIVLATAWYLLTSWIRNSFFPINPDFAYEFKAAANWSVLGAPEPAVIPLYALLYPTRSVAALEFDFLAKIAYIVVLFVPLAFRPFYRLRYLLPAVPWLFYALFSNYRPYYGIFNQYPTYVISFVFIAAIYAVSKIGNDWKAVRRSLLIILVSSLVVSIIVSPLSPVSRVSSPTPQHEELIREVLKYVPPDAAIMTQSNIFPHVSSRINAYAIPVVHQIWANKSEDFERFTNATLEIVEYVLVDFRSDPSAGRLIFSLVQQNPRFRVFASADSVILFRKDYTGKAELLAPYSTIYCYSNLTLYSGEIVKDGESTSGNVMFFDGASGPSPMFWHGPRGLLPSGEYTITLRLRANVTNVVGGELLTAQVCSENGRKILGTKVLLDSDLREGSTWTNQTFNLTFDEPLTDFEVRAVTVSGAADIYLDYIEVKQIG